MPDFVSPFPGNVERAMSQEEMIRALRLNLAAELEAIHMYTAQAEAAQDPLVRKALLDIADEERQHMGEFLELLLRMAPDEERFLEEGKREIEEMAREVRGG